MNRKAKVIIWILAILLLGFVAVYYFILRWDRITYYDGTYDEYESEASFAEELASCNVMGVNMHGEVYTYLTDSEYDLDAVSAEDIYYYLDQLDTDPEYKNIKVVVLEIDSYGGAPVAGEEIANKINEMSVPVIAVIRGAGASAAYWTASAADRIFASKVSDIGSIGVTMSYLDSSSLSKEEGLDWISLSSGKYKDAGNPDKTLTEEEKKIFQRDLDIIHEEFIKTVAKNRNLPIEKVRELADGSTMLGEAALREGLVDEIGYLKEVKDYIRKTYDIEPDFCWQ